MKLFTYGTLKRGFPLHHLLGGSEFLGVAETVEYMAMYAGRVPFVTERQRVSPIHGELFSVDGATLSVLDMVEGHPINYQRRKTKVRDRDGDEHRAWLYFYDHPIEHLNSVPTGRYES
tara:strand:- start:182 stop:535 length:354 start_codon:yes stop_codon:yes gene_type:complete